MLSIDMQFMIDEEKRQFLTWRPRGVTSWQVHAKQVAECIFPILILFGAHILSFHE